MPEHIGSLALRERGGAIVSLRDGFYTLDFATGACRKLVDPDPGKPRIRMNDGKVDRQGRFVAGYMDYEERDPICALFRLDAERRCRKARRRHHLLERPVLEPRRPDFYFADTGSAKSGPTTTTRRPANGANRRVFASFPATASRACRTARRSTPRASSGACPSMKGKLVRFAPDGRLDRVVGLPVESTTSLNFGGPDLDIAYVTSMARTVKGVKPREREAGALFAVYGLGVRGCRSRASPAESTPKGEEEERMRIEVLIDVKTILGEGPLWDVEEQRLYLIDSFG